MSQDSNEVEMNGRCLTEILTELRHIHAGSTCRRLHALKLIEEAEKAVDVVADGTWRCIRNSKSVTASHGYGNSDRLITALKNVGFYQCRGSVVVDALGRSKPFEEWYLEKTGEKRIVSTVGSEEPPVRYFYGNQYGGKVMVHDDLEYDRYGRGNQRTREQVIEAAMTPCGRVTYRHVYENGEWTTTKKVCSKSVDPSIERRSDRWIAYGRPFDWIFHKCGLVKVDNAND